MGDQRVTWKKLVLFLLQYIYLLSFGDFSVGDLLQLRGFQQNKSPMFGENKPIATQKKTPMDL